MKVIIVDDRNQRHELSSYVVVGIPKEPTEDCDIITGAVVTSQETLSDVLSLMCAMNETADEFAKAIAKSVLVKATPRQSPIRNERKECHNGNSHSHHGHARAQGRRR